MEDEILMADVNSLAELLLGRQALEESMWRAGLVGDCSGSFSDCSWSHRGHFIS